MTVRAPLLGSAQAPSMPHERHGLARRRVDLRVAVAVFVTLLIVASWIGLALLLKLERERAIQNVLHNDGNLARVFEEHILRTIRNADQTLRFIKSQYERNGANFDLERYASDIAKDTPLFNTLSIVDEHGDLILASRPFTPQNLRDREHFQVHAQRKTGELYISKPLQLRTTGQWSIFMTRRIDKPDGSFGGISVVALDSGYFSNFYNQIDLGKNGVVSLVGLDGIVRARQSDAVNDPGQDISSSPLFARLARESQGNYLATSRIDGVTRVLTYRAVRDYPLVVLVGTAEGSVLQRFYQRRTAYLSFVALGSVGFLLIAGLLIRQLSQQHELKLIVDRSEASLRELADAMPQLVWTARPDGTHDYHNGRWKEYIGIPCAQPQKSSWEQAIHPDDFDAYTEGWQVAIQSGSPFQIEYRLKDARDGVYRWHLGRSVPVRNASGEVVRWLGTCTDIEDQKRAQRLIVDLNEKLESLVGERTAQLESFSYSVSHDLRAPLRGISGFAQILSRRYSDSLNEQGQHFLDNIVEASAHMGRLIDDLLSYSRLGRSVIALKPVNLKEVLADIVRRLQPRIIETGASLEIADDLPVVHGDATLLSQIFTNLIDNALTYCQSGIPPHVTLTWQRTGKNIVFSVADSGIGIAVEHFKSIFNVFERLHTQDTYPGTGIGLAVVKKSVDLQGGKVWVTSIVGTGSTFHVQLPEPQPVVTHANQQT